MERSLNEKDGSARHGSWELKQLLQHPTDKQFLLTVIIPFPCSFSLNTTLGIAAITAFYNIDIIKNPTTPIGVSGFAKTG